MIEEQSARRQGVQKLSQSLPGAVHITFETELGEGVQKGFVASADGGPAKNRNCR